MLLRAGLVGLLLIAGFSLISLVGVGLPQTGGLLVLLSLLNAPLFGLFLGGCP